MIESDETLRLVLVAFMYPNLRNGAAPLPRPPVGGAE